MTCIEDLRDLPPFVRKRIDEDSLQETVTFLLEHSYRVEVSQVEDLEVELQIKEYNDSKSLARAVHRFSKAGWGEFHHEPHIDPITSDQGWRLTCWKRRSGFLILAQKKKGTVEE